MYERILLPRAERAAISNKIAFEKAKLRLDVAIKTREFEIELFWKRGLFFWGFVAAAFIAYANLIKEHAIYAALLGSFGFLCSFAWALANRGSKRWQETWEQKVEDAQNDPSLKLMLFGQPEEREYKGLWLSGRRYSVSRLAIALSDITAAMWLLLAVAPTVRIAWPNVYGKCTSLLLSILPLVLFAFMTLTGLFLAVYGRSATSSKGTDAGGYDPKPFRSFFGEVRGALSEWTTRRTKRADAT